MKVNYNQFLAVVYGDIFDWPLTKQELRLWQVNDQKTGGKRVGYKDGLYFLPGREKLVKQRLAREKMLTRKKMIAEVVASFLSKIPTVEAIFLTGSVATGSAKKGGDIDLMIVTRANTLWLTRIVVVVLLKSLQNYGHGRDRICPNIFLDTNHLKIKERNLYTAHEILQAKCLFDRRGVEKKWLARNKWTRNFLPNAYHLRIKHCKNENSLEIGNWKLKIGVILELSVFVCQYLYQLPKQTNERLGWGYAFFHPNHLAKKVEDKFAQRLVKYTS